MLTRLFSIIIALTVTSGIVHADPAADGIIDTHLHAMSCKKDGLDKVATWMDRNGVVRAVVHPLTPSRPKNEEQRKAMLEHFHKHDGKIERFCIIKPEEVSTVEEAVKILEREKKDGAIGFGEHYGTGLMFDDPSNMRLFAACEKVGLPVMFHMDGKQNKDTATFKHLENALKAYPKLIFIAHGPNWWKQLGSGNCSRMLETYRNLYADLSAGSGATALKRNGEYTAKLMVKHSERLLFGTDCGWWTFHNLNPKPAEQFAIMKNIDIPDEVKVLIYRDNAKRLFGFDLK